MILYSHWHLKLPPSPQKLHSCPPNGDDERAVPACRGGKRDGEESERKDAEHDHPSAPRKRDRIVAEANIEKVSANASSVFDAMRGVCAVSTSARSASLAIAEIGS